MSSHSKKKALLSSNLRSSDKPRRSLNLGSTNLSENKINHLALHLEYLFDRGVNFRERVITLTEEVRHPMFDLVDSALTEMESQSRKGITIRINSMGGSVYEALAIVGRIEASPCHIVTEGYGAIMSAATLILASGDKRRISKLAWFMHHCSQYETGGRHSEIKAFVAQAEREEQEWSKWMEFFTKKKAGFWAKTGFNVDAYFTAPELIDLGVADELF